MRKHCGTISLLVAEDDEQLRRMLFDVFSMEGYQVRACPDAFVALEKLTTEEFDLLITDLGMPGMSGLELAETLHATHPHIPVVLITGLGAELNQTQVSLKEIRSILLKPFQLSELKALIVELVTGDTGSSRSGPSET